MKKIKYLLSVLIILVISFSMIYADNNYSLSGTEQVNYTGEIQQYVVYHPCHDGASHEYCYLDHTFYVWCGCVTETYYCCCGQKMPTVYLVDCGTH